MFDRRVQLLKLVEDPMGHYRWQPAANIWAHPEPQKHTNIFSKVGLGARSVLFSMHPRALDLHQAILWNGKHHFLTAIDRPSPVLMEVTAAVVETVNCTALRSPDGVDEDKQPLEGLETVAVFPAVLTEKYLGYQQREALSESIQILVLVTPKPVNLVPGDQVEVEGLGGFVVRVPHTLDPYKNEYEIYREEDV